MLNISKYHKLIVGCSAIATASIGGFVQSADAAGINNQAAQSTPSTTLIANGSLTGSNNSGVSPQPSFINSNGSGTSPGKGGFFDSNNGGKGVYYSDAKGNVVYYFDSNNGGIPGKQGVIYYYDSNNGGKGEYKDYFDSNNGGKGPQYVYLKDGPKGPGFYSYNDSNAGGGGPVKPDPVKPDPVKPDPVKPDPVKPDPVKPDPVKPDPVKPDPVKPDPVKPDPVKPDPVKPDPVKPDPVKPDPVIGKLPQNGSDGGATSNGSLNGSNTGSFRPGFNPTIIALGKASFGRIGIAQGKYDAALSALAAAEAATPNTSSKTSPVRYGREPGDLAACGCPNADTTTAGTPSPELVAARATEAGAAAELAAAKAEARQFLESVKVGTESVGSGANRTIW